MLTTVIEKYLSGVDQATFQKMMNHLLHLEGYKFIGSPGAVIGKNKTSKGTPDSFFEDGDGYAFCEYTTQEKLTTGEKFFDKLKKDVAHCFDAKTTGIKHFQISKVILAFTEEIAAKEHNELKEIVKNHNPNSELIVYTIQKIPFRLVYYPGLADKYIPGIKTTKGTFYTLLDFLKTTEKGLQPSLTNPFTGREAEINQAKTDLLSNDILVVTGSQGLGKSKLAVELAEIFERDYGFEPRVIAGSPVPLWEDLSSFILPDKKYFIFFDDANKSLPNLDYLLQFINTRDQNTTKVVITVRDYVRQDLDKLLTNVAIREITIKPLDDKEIKHVVDASLPTGKSLDPLVSEKVISLAKGNSRLALMATSSILKNNDISVLNNVFSLYDQYFQKVKTDLTFLDKPNNLKALGVLSFFGVMDKNNEELKKALEIYFEINWNELWETFIELENAELVDVFSKEAAKLSDQVLATYVFYKTFIDQNFALIDYSAWLLVFIAKYPKKIRKTLIDIINTFGYEELKDRVSSLISNVQNRLSEEPKLLIKFYDIFWFYREVDTLLFIKNWIESLQTEETELKDISYTYQPNDLIWPSEHLSLLINFWNHSTQFTKDSLELTLELMFRQPSRIPEILKHLKENISFHRFDYRYGYPRQVALIETLGAKNYSVRERAISDQVFLSIATELLGWEFTQTENKGDGQMVIYNFGLVKTRELMELRRKIIDRLSVLFVGNENSVLSALNKYAWTARSFDASVYADEQPLISNLIKTNLTSENYAHCKFVYQYAETLTEQNIKLTNNWEEYLNSQSIQIAKIFSTRFKDEDLHFDEQEAKQRQEIKDFVVGKDIDFIKATFHQLNSIYKDAITSQDTYWVDTSLVYLFQSLSETDAKLYFKSVELLMVGNYEFALPYGNIISYPVRQKLVVPKEMYEHINRYEYKQKQSWKQMFFEALDEVDINQFFLLEFISFMFSISNRFYAYEIAKLTKFDKQFISSKSLLPPSATNHDTIITFVVEILLSKTSTADISFERNFCEKTYLHFTTKTELLKKVFFLESKKTNHYDYSGKEMAAVSSLDHYFVVEYLNETTRDKNFLKFRFDNLNLSFIWKFSEYEDILDKALEVIIAKAPIFSNTEHQANVLFKGQNLGQEDLEKVYAYISRFIVKNYTSKQHIHIILNVVTYCYNSQVLRFLREFLLLNKDIEFMKHLWLEKNSGFSGSLVPGIEAHIKFLKSLIEMAKALPNPLDYAAHIKSWEQQIEWSIKHKQEEMKRDFTGWDD